MSGKSINQKAIQNYLKPQLEVLKALLKQLHFTNSLSALQFFQQMIETDTANRSHDSNTQNIRNSNKKT